ncbi:MAG: hypothetical protein OEY52_04500 [Gammaproteobacteria bacterium]|nr:hypothetical protein [Gammaproteobacteria bacterium]
MLASRDKTTTGKIFWQFFILPLLLFVSSLQAATLHNASYDWFTLESENFYLTYHEGLEEIARDTLSLAEQIHKRLSKRLKWDPVYKTHVVLTDEYDFSNGFAIPFPNLFTTLFITPPDDLITLEDHAGWIETVLTHEYAHILHLDKVEGMPDGVRSVFGRHPLGFPNILQPRWLIEGYATFIETDRERGIGRGQSSLYEGMMRAELLGEFKPLKMVNQPMASWPMGTSWYMYGVFWHEFIEQTYGRQQIEMGIEHHSNNILPFSINRTAKSTYGKEHLDLWDDFEIYMNKKFQPQIKAIKKQGVVEGKRLSFEGYLNGPVRTLPTGEAYYVSYNGEREPSLMKIGNNKEIERLTDVHLGARLDVHPESGVLLSQLEICGAGQMYADLYRLDLDGDDMEKITDCARYRNAIWSPDGKSIMAVKYARGITELHLLDDWGKLKEVVWKGKLWEVIGGLDWSPTKNELIAAVYREQGGWNLEKFNLNTRKWSYVLKDSAIVGYPQYTDDGRYVLFTSEHGKVYNIRRLDTRNGNITTLTNVLTGALSPSQTPDGDVFYIGYSSEGLDVYHLASKDIKPSPLPKSAKGTTGKPLPKPPVIEPISVSEYSPWDTLAPAMWQPYFYFDEDRSEWGVFTAGYDSLLQHAYGVGVAYDSKNDWWDGTLAYVYDGLYPTITLDVEQYHSNVYYEDNVVSEKVYVRRIKDSKLEIMFPFRGLSSGWTFNMAAMKHEEDDVVDFDKGRIPPHHSVDNVAGMALTYDSSNRPIQSISRTQGRMISLVGEDSDAISGSDYKGQVYWMDWREYIRLGGRQVFGMRYVEGKGMDTTRPFLLGGSNNNDNLSNSVTDPIFGSPFKKRAYNLRGYPEGLKHLTGQNLRLASGEYRFPLGRLERGQMSPPLGLHQIHGSLFYEAGATWDKGTEPEHHYRSYGAELHFDTVFFYLFTAQITLGYAEGIDKGGESRSYLRLGASF